jgi:hypothetical protein
MGILDRFKRKKDEPMKQQQEVSDKPPATDFMERLLTEDKPLGERMAYEFSEKLFNKKLLYMISDLNQDQRSTIIHLHIISKFFYEPYANEENKHIAQDFIDALLMLTISKNREGRRELVEMIIGLKGGVGALLPQRQGQEGRRWFR